MSTDTAEPARYDPHPRYPAVGGRVLVGWHAGIEQLAPAVTVLALDGPPTLDWTSVVGGVLGAVRASGRTARAVDIRERYVVWDEVLRRTDDSGLAGDPDFARLATVTVDAFFDGAPTVHRAEDDDLVLVFGSGSALTEPDELWYLEQPKRYAEAAVIAGTGRHLGQREAEDPTTRRLFYIDWPILDRHRAAVAAWVGRWWDLQDPLRPSSLAGAALIDTLAGLVHRPFRTRPTFNTTSWGGHWAQRELGMNAEAPNTALGYELIAPESGILVGADAQAQLEFPFQLMVDLHPRALMGDPVYEVFGTSFPIRFDYLDTVAGGSLSVHCHPQSEYMRSVFGWPYPQHETYYTMVDGADSVVYLGVRGDLDVEQFRLRAESAEKAGESFDIADFVNTFPAMAHQLFLIPAGTPHGSGIGNVVLEVSATPYLYSLRFYDWLRRDSDGRQRSVHVGHAFENLNTERRGEQVARDLVPTPQVLRSGEGWQLELIGHLPEMFFDVHRLVLQPGACATETDIDRFRVLNLVEGDEVEVSVPGAPAHRLSYAETIVVPASVGACSVTCTGSVPARLVTSLVC